MTIRALLKSSLEGELPDQNSVHGGNCGCSFCMPNNLDRLELKDPTIVHDVTPLPGDDVLVTQQTEYKAKLINALTNTVTALESLSRVNLQSVSPDLLLTTCAAIVGKTNTKLHMPSIEAFKCDYSEAAAISVESIDTMIEYAKAELKSLQA